MILSMPNPGQTQIFYKAGQTQLTWAKCDPVDPDDPDDPTRLQHWLYVAITTTAKQLLLIGFVNLAVHYLKSRHS